MAMVPVFGLTVHAVTQANIAAESAATQAAERQYADLTVAILHR